MATADTARNTAMTARAQRRDFRYMGSPGGGGGQTGQETTHPTQHHTDSDTNIVPTLAPTPSAQDTWKKHSI